VPRDEQEDRDVPQPRNWTEWREEAHETLEELDRALAQARQVIYRLRPMVRPKSDRGDEPRQPRQERPAQFQRRRSRK
jgi:hypothetical protein